MSLPSELNLRQYGSKMHGSTIKRLFKAIQGSNPVEISSVCRRIVAEERQKGHGNVAADLERLLPKPDALQSQTGRLTPLPTSRRDSSPLVHHLPHASLRHEMVLPESVEVKFQRIEREHAARNRLAHFGLRPRCRILLYGPPGCGKSLGAERLAWATGLDLKKVRFDTLISSFFGETASNLARIFEDIAKTPCALFLDECDTIAKSRTHAGNDVGEIARVVNALLEHLDAYQGDGLIIAATNLDETLDPAIFRRFDEVVKLPQPTSVEIERLLRQALSSVPVKKGLAWKELAQQMDGLSCAEAVRTAQNAARRAVMECRKQVTKEDVDSALREHLEHPMS